jgi:hypothetical protein
MNDRFGQVLEFLAFVLVLAAMSALAGMFFGVIQ